VHPRFIRRAWRTVARAAILSLMWQPAKIRPPMVGLVEAVLFASTPLLCGPGDQIRIDGEPLFRSDPAVFVRLLESRRPEIVSSTMRQQILASLPAEGEIKQLSSSDRSSLASLEPVLRVHGRESAYVIKVFPAPQMFVGLHARTVLLISGVALRLLKPVELQAVVAHEIGHEYVWDEYETATQSGTKARLQKLELYCDAVAVVTLQQIGVNPAIFASAIEKVSSYNHVRFGVASNEDSYPSPHDRRIFDETAIRWAARLHGNELRHR
jgi:hypothetical protein